MNRQRFIILRKQRYKSTAILTNDVQISPGEHAKKAHTYGKAVQDYVTYMYHEGIFFLAAQKRIFNICLPFTPQHFIAE